MSQVRLAQYDPEDVLDESVLWTESYDVGDGFRCIRMVNSIYLNLDALGGTEENGGIRDGTVVGLWEWHEGDNQCWSPGNARQRPARAVARVTCGRTAWATCRRSWHRTAPCVSSARRMRSTASLLRTAWCALRLRTPQMTTGYVWC
jgi:hypothetical protein